MVSGLFPPRSPGMAPQFPARACPSTRVKIAGTPERTSPSSAFNTLASGLPTAVAIRRSPCSGEDGSRAADDQAGMIAGTGPQQKAGEEMEIGEVADYRVQIKIRSSPCRASAWFSVKRCRSPSSGENLISST